MQSVGQSSKRHGGSSRGAEMPWAEQKDPLASSRFQKPLEKTKLHLLTRHFIFLPLQFLFNCASEALLNITNKRAKRKSAQFLCWPG